MGIKNMIRVFTDTYFFLQWKENFMFYFRATKKNAKIFSLCMLNCVINKKFESYLRKANDLNHTIAPQQYSTFLWRELGHYMRSFVNNLPKQYGH